MKISVVGLFRDSEKHIHRTLSLLSELDSLGDFDFYFYENDSIDNTKNILEKWLVDRKGKLLSENINSPRFGSVPNVERLVLLSYYRNKSKELIVKNSQSEYTLLIDTDIVFTTEDFLILLNFMQKERNAAMVVSNTRQYQIEDLMNHETQDSFYDVFAFRDKLNNNGLYFTDCPFILNEDRTRWSSDQAVHIKSGFSGFALLRTDIIKNTDCFWSTCGNSEHVNFCYSVSKYGDIFMLPYCKPTTEINLSSISINACKQIAEKQKDLINNVNYIYNISTSNSIQIK
jgi:hypothetical protein